MKQQKSHYFKWGLTVFLTVCAILAFYDTFYMNGTLQRYLSKLVTVLAPVLYGFAMAYLLAPIVNWIEGLIRKGLKRLSKGQEPKLRGGLLRGVSILLAWAVVAYLLYLLMSVLIPQLIDSVAMLINNAESYYNKIYVWVTNLLEKNPEIAGWVEKNLESYYNDLMKVLTEQVLPGAQQMLTTITGGIWTGIWGLVTFTTNFLVGIIISVYLLAMKEKSLARCCKLLYALLQEEQARWVVRATRKTNQIFSGFVRGKMLDSLIIGILCFIGCSIFSLPYTPLVSVVVGVTNMIPFFGPFLGAAPSAFLILLVSPKQCLIFIVFIIVLQQIDGNIIGPKILGNTTGLSSFWVLFAILLFGGLWGRGAGNVPGRAHLRLPADAGKVPHRPAAGKASYAAGGLRIRPPGSGAHAAGGASRSANGDQLTAQLPHRHPLMGCRCFFAGRPPPCRGMELFSPHFFVKTKLSLANRGEMWYIALRQLHIDRPSPGDATRSHRPGATIISGLPPKGRQGRRRHEEETIGSFPDAGTGLHRTHRLRRRQQRPGRTRK